MQLETKLELGRPVHFLSTILNIKVNLKEDGVCDTAFHGNLTCTNFLTYLENERRRE